jgi:hypothetical protein
VILPAVGLDQGLKAGAALNAICVALVLPFVLRREPAPDADVPPTEPLREPDARLPFQVWLLIYAASGFVALSLEIVWFRLLGVMARVRSPCRKQ